MNIELITSAGLKPKETGFGLKLACHDVLNSLKRLGHSVKLTVCCSLHDLHAVVERNPDLVVLAAKYMSTDKGDDIWFSEYFEANEIAYSGSSRETLRYDSDKVLAKVRLASLGVRTAKYFTAVPGQYTFEEDLPFSFPFFVKPTDAANGNGVDDQSFVENFAEYEAKVYSLYSIYKQPALVEEYLCGKEFTVAVIKSNGGVMTVSAIEIVPPLSSGTLRILGATVKKLDSETLKKIEYEDINSVKELAVKSFQGLGARGFGRIDVKMDNSGLCYFLEANLVPGMNNGTSYFPRACEIDSEMSYDKVIQMIFSECFERAIVKKEFNEQVPVMPLALLN